MMKSTTAQARRTRIRGIHESRQEQAAEVGNLTVELKGVNQKRNQYSVVMVVEISALKRRTGR